jgi:hypothetical protein
MLLKCYLFNFWLDFSYPPVHLSLWRDDGEYIVRWWRLNLVVTPYEKLKSLSRNLQEPRR